MKVVFILFREGYQRVLEMAAGIFLRSDSGAKSPVDLEAEVLLKNDGESCISVSSYEPW